jgi:hypothetical protein
MLAAAPMTGLRRDADALGRLLAETLDDYQPAASALCQQLDGSSAGTLNAAAAALLEWAPRCSSIDREALIFILSGTIVEHGADPEIGWDHLQSRMRRCVQVLATNIEQLKAANVDLDARQANDNFDAELRGWASQFPFLVVAAMARLARQPQLRQKVRLLDGFASNVSMLEQQLPSVHGHYLSEILNVLDDQILLIDVRSQVFSLVEVRAVRNCAHLFALLEEADTEAIGSTAGASYEIRHHYASFGCLDEETTGIFHRTTRLNDADWMFMLGVEMSGHNIPKIEVPGVGAVRVVVCAKSRFGSRSFVAADFFSPIHDALIGSVVPVRSISGSEQNVARAVVLTAARTLRRALGRTNGAAPFPPGLTEHPAWLDHWNQW